jgi:hypothetical protein
MYLLDANVLIFAKRDYYPMDRFPEYWDWLLYQAECGNVKIPSQIWDELQEHDDDVRAWVREHREVLILDCDDIDLHVPDVLSCYADDLTESELEQIGADPFLVAGGIATKSVVVSKEGSAPSRQRANRKVPDICTRMGVRCITDHLLIRELDFRTNWRAHG